MMLVTKQQATVALAITLAAGVASAAPGLARQARQHVSGNGPVGRVLDVVAQINLFPRSNPAPSEAPVSIRLQQVQAEPQLQVSGPVSVGISPEARMPVAMAPSAGQGRFIDFAESPEPFVQTSNTGVGSGFGSSFSDRLVSQGPALVTVGSTGAGGFVPTPIQANNQSQAPSSSLPPSTSGVPVVSSPVPTSATKVALQSTSPSPVPEPATYAMLLGGLSLMAFVLKRKGAC